MNETIEYDAEKVSEIVNELSTLRDQLDGKDKDIVRLKEEIASRVKACKFIYSRMCEVEGENVALKNTANQLRASLSTYKQNALGPLGKLVENLRREVQQLKQGTVATEAKASEPPADETVYLDLSQVEIEVQFTPTKAYEQRINTREWEWKFVAEEAHCKALAAKDAEIESLRKSAEELKLSRERLAAQVKAAERVRFFAGWRVRRAMRIAASEFDFAYQIGCLSRTIAEAYKRAFGRKQ